MKTHELKCWPEFFESIWAGDKTCEVRKNDRLFETGDQIWLREYAPSLAAYTGREILVEITHMLSADDLCRVLRLREIHFCVMSIKVLRRGTVDPKAQSPEGASQP